MPAEPWFVNGTVAIMSASGSYPWPQLQAAPNMQVRSSNFEFHVPLPQALVVIEPPRVIKSTPAVLLRPVYYSNRPPPILRALPGQLSLPRNFCFSEVCDRSRRVVSER